MQETNNSKINFGFTIVELIVTIVIIAILASIAFITLKDYPKLARDGVRKSDLQTIQKSLNYYYSNNQAYPQPDEINLDSGEKISVFGSGVVDKLSDLSSVPVDPLTKKPYKYTINGNWGYVLEGKLEENNQNLIEIGGKNFQNCADILLKYPNSEDGIYYIKSGKIALKVECDMTTEYNGVVGGWTKYLDIKSNYTMQQAKDCWMGKIINSPQMECFNPIKFNLNAKEFLAKLTDGATTNSYTYTSNSDNSENYVKTSRGGYRCLGGKNYMTIMRGGSTYPPEDASVGVSRVRLGLSYCKTSRSLGGTSGGRYFMNYTHTDTLGPRPGSRSRTVKPVKIYIR